ncbi:MAG TPA: DUF2336 domain-containing protein [Pseudolabrys sp.]|nr:DUF2336 domain-containing protein [Pseudolabrys sp.]
MIKQPVASPIDALVDLACRDGVDVRPTLLRVLTDLYVQKPAHSSDEEIQCVELALGLIDAIDDQTRAAVAASLAAYPAAPKAILERLGAQSLEPALPRAPDDGNDLRELFFAASSDERRLILLNLDATGAARPAIPPDGEIVKRLENAALARNSGEFARTLERALSIEPHLASRIARDASGEPIVVAARALGMKAAVLQRIILFLNPEVGQSVQRVFDLARLFDELPRASAERMLALWRGERTPQRPAQNPDYEPAYGADGARDNRALSTRRGTLLPGRQSERTRSVR